MIKLQSQEETIVEEPLKDKELEFQKNHPKELVISSPLEGDLTRSKSMGKDSHSAFLSKIEQKSFQQAKKEESWMIDKQEELNQFE